MQRTGFKSRWLPYVLVAPQMVVTVLFFFWPALKSLQLSFYRVSPFGDKSTFVCLENFTKLLADPDYYASVVDSFLFAGRVTVLPLLRSPAPAPLPTHPLPRPPPPPPLPPSPHRPAPP